MSVVAGGEPVNPAFMTTLPSELYFQPKLSTV